MTKHRKQYNTEFKLEMVNSLKSKISVLLMLLGNMISANLLWKTGLSVIVLNFKASHCPQVMP